MASEVRHPRAVISVNGQRLTPLECQINVSSHQSADTFSATLALSALPDGLDANYWSDANPLPVTIEATNDVLTGGYTEMIVGTADQVEIDFYHKQLRIGGRDKTADMIEAKTNEKWINHTGQQIIQDIAGRHGLSVDFSGDDGKAGLNYAADYNRLTDQDSEWNTVVRLAEHDGCVAFVKGSKLIIKKADAADGGVYPLIYEAGNPARGNFLTLRAVRNLTLAKKVNVKVSTWQQKQKKAVESEYESDGGSGALAYAYRGANLTKEQADRLAEKKLLENTSHERAISVEAPGDVSIDPRMQLELSGTGTAFDQSYIISDIEHRFGQTEGYRMSIRVRNADKKRSATKVK